MSPKKDSAKLGKFEGNYGFKITGVSVYLGHLGTEQNMNFEVF